MQPAQPPQRLAEYLTVGEAAEFLGVSPWTLRNWDRAGKLDTLRNPKNGYRIYRREDLETLLRLQVPGGRLQHPDQQDWSEGGDGDHIVQFYESDGFLTGSVSRFLGAALGAGDGAILIATRTHREAIQRKLRSRGLNLSVARAEGQLVSLDAAETLGQFMVGDFPDPERFQEVIGEVVAGVGRGRPRVKAFGEMVALLWAEGKREGAIRLEELWNDLQKTHPFSLYCAYPIRAFNGPAQEVPFHEVCTCHSRVLPAESYAALPGEGERLVTIARLQQKAQALEAEIAHRQEVEARLIAVQAALREADRRKNEFLAVLAHEERNYLAPIRNAVEALRRLDPGRPDTCWAIDVVHRQVSQLTRLVDDLLDLTRIAQGKLQLRKETVELAEVVHQAVETCQPLVESRRHTLSVSLPSARVRLEGDRTRLAQVLTNLLTNSAKYTPEGGRIWLTGQPDGAEVIIRVRDNGVGIPPERLAGIFEMFSQVEETLGRSQGGLGIGLSLVRSVVELHGGTVQAGSAGPGQGSTFTVRLPALRGGKDEEEQGKAESASAGETAICRILVVDDNRDAAESLAMLLRFAGHEVHTAHTGPAALTAAGKFRPGVVLLDLGLPGMDGLEVARRLRRDYSAHEMRLVALTGYGSDEDRRQCHEAGFDDHLLKPVELDALERLLAGAG